MADVATTAAQRFGLVGRPVAPSVDALLAGAVDRRPLDDHEGKSGARLERLAIDGRAYVVKHLVLADDWIRRATHDDRCRSIQLWELGVYDQLPGGIDSAMAGCARDGHDGVLLLHDLGDRLVPDGDGVVSLDDHRAFVAAMAALHAHYLGLDDELGLLPLGPRLTEFSPASYRAERAAGYDSFIPGLAQEGWQRMATTSPALADLVLPLLEDPAPLVAACEASGPLTLVHGNWKLANLGRHPDGRTILIDWESPGRAPGPFDLTWYLAINIARLPEAHEAVIDAYRTAFLALVPEATAWFDAQLDLALIGAFAQLGWEKCLGERGAELDWWEARVLAAAARLP